jgi:hypothetical protein
VSVDFGADAVDPLQVTLDIGTGTRRGCEPITHGDGIDRFRGAD